MNYLPVLDENNAGSEAKEVLATLKKKFGRVPNIYAAMANSPQTVLGLMGFKKELHEGTLSLKEEEAIALVVGEANKCEYCVAAHTALAKMAGFSPEEARQLRGAQHSDPKLDALVKLAKEITVEQGRPGEVMLENFYNVGYDDAALTEVLAQVVINIFTNYFNHIAAPDIDFPSVD